MSAENMIEQRIHGAVTRALGIRALDPSLPLKMGATPGWDSMGHMAVVMELEKEFKTTFPPYRLPELIDIPSIAKVVQGS